MKAVGPLFLPWVQEVIRDEEVAVIFLKEFWPRIVGDGLAKSTAPLRLRKRTLEIGVSGREWEQVLQGMALPELAFKELKDTLNPWFREETYDQVASACQLQELC